LVLDIKVDRLIQSTGAVNSLRENLNNWFLRIEKTHGKKQKQFDFSSRLRFRRYC
jgi:hypothetical protein